MMNFGRVVSMFNRAAPKISRGIGHVADIGRNIGQVVRHSRNIGLLANQNIRWSFISMTYSPKKARCSK